MELVVPGLGSREQRAFITVMRAIRLERGLTQRQLAERCKRPHSYVSKIEAGQRLVQVADIPRIANALGLPEIKFYQRYARWRDAT